MDAIKTRDWRKHKTPLQLAILSKNVDRILSLLRETQDVNVRDDDGRTALHQLLGSCLYRDVRFSAMFSELLTPTAVNIQDNDGNSLLHLAIKTAHYHWVPLMVNVGADVNMQNAKGETSLHILCTDAIAPLCSTRVLHHIVSRNNINMQDSEGNTPLHVALKHDNGRLAYYLRRQYKPDLSICDSSRQQTVLHLVLWKKPEDSIFETVTQTSVIKLFVSPDNLNLQDIEGNAPIHIAFKNKPSSDSLEKKRGEDLLGPLETLLPNMNRQDRPGLSPFHQALKGKHLDRAKFLLQHCPKGSNKGSSDSLAKNLGPDLSTPLDVLLMPENINLQDKDGNSPLHLALKGNHFDDAKFLLQHSPDTTLQNREQMTALHVACKVDAPLELVKKIISEENVNIKDNRGNTALFYAVKTQSDLLPLVIQYEVEIDYKDISLVEWELLAEAIIHSDFCSDAFHKSARDYILPMIISRTNRHDFTGKTALHHLLLTNNNAFLMDVVQSEMVSKDIGLCDNESLTPLHYAMFWRKTFDEGVIDALITPTNVNLSNRHGYTPLHRMISKWPEQLFHYLEGNNVSEIGKRMMNKLITKENINLKSHIDMTLLRFVVSQKRWDSIPSVLERGADVCSLFENRQHAVKYTILHDAIEHHMPADTFKLIISHENAKLSTNLQHCSTNILCCAVSHQRWDLMQLLLDYGADINARNGKDINVPSGEMAEHTALHRAIQARNTPLEIIAQLISHENISMETRSGETAKTLAIQTGQWHVLKLLLSHGYRQTGPLSLLCGLTIKQYVPEVSKCMPEKMRKDIEALGEYLSSASFSNTE